MTNTEPAWITALKPGDRVIYIAGRISGDNDSIARVERLTATQVVVKLRSNDSYLFRFRRADGSEVANRGAWAPRNSIVEATPERVAAIRYRRLAHRLRRHEWKDEPREVLDQVEAIIFSPPAVGGEGQGRG